MSVHYRDDTVTLLLGDAGEQAASLPPSSVQAVVTSPPYFGLRDYGVDGQLGAESSPTEFVVRLVSVFDAIRPALAKDGVLWVNLGDTYAAAKRGGDEGWDKSRLSNPAGVQKRQFASMREGREVEHDRPLKNMLGIPWRFAFAMQDAGWILRNDIIWAKPNAMPESVRDRFSTKHEHVFLFAKSTRYHFDIDAVGVPTTGERAGNTAASRIAYGDGIGTSAGRRAGGNPGSTLNDVRDTRNPGDVWEISTKPFTGAHFAVFPPEIPERCILASTRPGDIVLDPFSGSGTTGMVATKHGRKYIGIDLNAEYHDLALKTRLAQGVLS